MLGQPRNAAHQHVLRAREVEARNILLKADEAPPSLSRPPPPEVSHVNTDATQPSPLPGLVKGTSVSTKSVPTKSSSSSSQARPAATREESVRAVLARQEVEREEMTGEMVTMAQDLKRVHLRTREQLMIDKSNLATLDKALEDNVDATAARKRAVDELLETSWANTWLYWALIAIVCCSFVGMYLFMKVVPR